MGTNESAGKLVEVARVYSLTEADVRITSRPTSALASEDLPTPEEPSIAPEPTTASLLAMGTLVLMAKRRNTRKRRA